jgi:putative intracellular protease/amidase
MRVLIVVTSHDRLGGSGRRTGVWLESFAIGYYACLDAGLDVCVSSPSGGPAPIDPSSDDRHSASSIVQRYAGDHEARGDLADTLMLSQVCPVDFAAVYYADGQGALWDLPNDRESRALIAQLHRAGRPCAFVGHGVAALIGAGGSDGRSVRRTRLSACRQTRCLSTARWPSSEPIISRARATRPFSSGMAP